MVMPDLFIVCVSPVSPLLIMGAAMISRPARSPARPLSHSHFDRSIFLRTLHRFASIVLAAAVGRCLHDVCVCTSENFFREVVGIANFAYEVKRKVSNLGQNKSQRDNVLGHLN